MIQLKTYIKDEKIPENSIFLDLYETQPIKLTISIEDITSADATSAFSRTFKVPATRNNSEFFENAFDVNGVTYDITKKKPAEILVDGGEFKVGHIRLNKIYVNGDQDKIDYELLFLGETRDFSSAIGDAPLCQLIMEDLAPDNGNTYTREEILESWEAFPSIKTATGIPQTPTLTSGLASGNLIFPLIDHGNTYDENGDPQQAVITVDQSGPLPFSTTPLGLTRLKPMIRAKRIWDQIFEEAGYTYESDFIDSERFHQMYVSAFGNNESIEMEVAQSTDTQFEAKENNTQSLTDEPLELNDVVWNQSGNYNPSTSKYTAPAANTSGNYYIMSGWVQGSLAQEESDYGYDYIPWRIELYNQDANNGAGAVLATGNQVYNANGISSFSFDSRNSADNIINASDKLYLRINESPYDIDIAYEAYWDCTAAPGIYTASTDLDCETKQIDFIKDILTMFRLVMQPDVYKPNHFIIEPWQEFIASGDLYDWSKKLVKDKDFVIEPLFDTQSQTIEFTLSEDEDFINQFHQDNYKHPYGWLQFNSDNELLKGKRDVKVESFSPTPLDQISHGGGNHPHAEWVIPTIVKVETVDTGSNPTFEKLAIKSNTRILFYNGIQDIDQTVSGNTKRWRLGTNADLIRWPLVSSYEDWPIVSDTLNLNFYNDVKYYATPSPGAAYLNDGQTLFTEYWSRYILSIYNKFSRKVTAYFILDNVDLQNLTFDDIIFVNGVYYRPQLISNAEVGNKTAVKVELITVLDYEPVWRNEGLTGVTMTGVAPIDAISNGTIDVTTNGTPPFTVVLNNGNSTVYTDTPGGAPYNFIVDNVPPGDYTAEMTDALQRDYQSGTINVPPFGGTPPQTGLLVELYTSACGATGTTGIVTNTSGIPIPIGGFVKIEGSNDCYEVLGGTGTGTLFGNVEFAYDNCNTCNGITPPPPPQTLYTLEPYTPGCFATGTEIVATNTKGVVLPLDGFVQLEGSPDCYQIINATGTGTPTGNIDSAYDDCFTCNNI